MAAKKPTGSLDEAEKNLQTFENDIKSTVADRAEGKSPEMEAQTKLSSKEISNSKDVYLKPIKTIRGRDKPNSKFDHQRAFDQEMVHFIAENKELIGESIDIWTKPHAGIPAEEWLVPVNKPVWGPRYLAEQIKRKYYHRLIMKENDIVSQDGMGTYSGRMVSDTTIARLDAHKVTENKSFFTGKSSF